MLPIQWEVQGAQEVERGALPSAGSLLEHMREELLRVNTNRESMRGQSDITQDRRSGYRVTPIREVQVNGSHQNKKGSRE